MEVTARTLALVLEYDGSGFHGFARQQGLPSVAERVEQALGTLFGHDLKIEAAGRTDAGVHATGQVVSCVTTSRMEFEDTPGELRITLRVFGEIDCVWPARIKHRVVEALEDSIELRYSERGCKAGEIIINNN